MSPYPARPAALRFWEKVDKYAPCREATQALGPCWVWAAAIAPNGYGLFRAERQMQAHRFAFREACGWEPPRGDEIDHLCRTRSCVRPSHLEAVTHLENVRRGIRGVLTTNCPQGHAYEGENLYVNPKGARTCRECTRAAKRRYRARRAMLPGAVAEAGRMLDAYLEASG